MNPSTETSGIRPLWARPIAGMFLVAILTIAPAVGRGAAPEGVDPRKPSALTTEQVPPIPSELVERLSQYLNGRSAGFDGWAPDGKGILVATRFGATTQLHRVYEPGGRREQVTFFDEPAGGRFLPGRASETLLVTMSRGGDENYQIYRLDRGSGRTTLLTDGKSRNTLGPVLENGRKFVVSNNRRNGRDTDLYLADPDKPGDLVPLLETDGEYWNALDWSHDGVKLLLNRYVSINETYPAIFDVSTKSKRPIELPKGAGKVAYGNLSFAPDDRHVYLTTDLFSEFQELVRFDLETSEAERLTADIPWDISSIEVERGRGRVAFAVNENGTSALWLLDGAERKRLAFPTGVVGGLKFSPDRRQLGFTLATPNAPADAYSIELESGKLVRWTYSEVGGLNPETFIKPVAIKFPSFDGREIPAFYSKPRGASKAKPAPVLITIHGGPESQYLPTFSGVEQFYLNELGIAVIAPNVRGSAGYGKTYLTLDNGPKREDSVRDIGALLDWIAKQPELDASRVAVSGGSYGGYMVLGSLVNFPDRIKAGIDIVGIANFLTFLERTSPYRRDLRRAEYGDERDPAMREAFERISPSNRVEAIRSALFVAHGKNDPRVPFFEAELIANKVREKGRAVWTVYADNEGHGFGKKENRDYLTAAIALFLQQKLLEKSKSGDANTK